MTREELLSYLRAQGDVPFQWGVNDCVHFAAAGRYPVGFTYDSEVAAKRILADAGGLEAAVSQVLGPARTDLRECMDGDVVLASFKDYGHVLGLALGKVFFMKTQAGPVPPVEMRLALRFWPCPL